MYLIFAITSVELSQQYIICSAVYLIGKIEGIGTLKDTLPTKPTSWPSPSAGFGPVRAEQDPGH